MVWNQFLVLYLMPLEWQLHGSDATPHCDISLDWSEREREEKLCLREDKEWAAVSEWERERERESQTL